MTKTGLEKVKIKKKIELLTKINLKLTVFT